MTQYHGEQIAYHRNDDGTLSQMAVLVTSDGDYHDQHGHPLTPTEDTDTLHGWPTEGAHRVYRNSGGREILIQEQE